MTFFMVGSGSESKGHFTKCMRMEKLKYLNPSLLTPSSSVSWIHFFWSAPDPGLVFFIGFVFKMVTQNVMRIFEKNMFFFDKKMVLEPCSRNTHMP